MGKKRRKTESLFGTDEGKNPWSISKELLGKLDRKPTKLFGE